MRPPSRLVLLSTPPLSTDEPMYNTQRRPSRPRNGGYSQRGRSPSSSGRNFESNGPANFRVRGKPIQIHDKYVQLARDSAANGDKILTENLLQHAEHYLRMQTFERDKNAPERSSERNSEDSEDEGEGGYRRFAPRAGARRRWAVAPEGPAREGYASSEPTTAAGQSVERPSEQPREGSEEGSEDQAEVEQRRPLSEGGLATAEASESARSDNERDYGSGASYE